AGVEVHAAAQLASAHHALLLHQRAQQLWRLHGDPALAAVGQVEVRAGVAARPRIAERHAAAPDVDRQGFGRAREAFLGDGAAAGLAVLAVVAASPCGTDPLDRPQLPAWSAQDEGRAAVADREVAVLDLPAHRPAVGGATIRRERGARLAAFRPGSTLRLDNHGQQLLPGPLECSGLHLPT